MSNWKAPDTPPRPGHLFETENLKRRAARPVRSSRSTSQPNGVSVTR